jgi:hypothetical protein
VLGFHAVGDAHTCTNPLYGRGCSLALIQAFAVVEVFVRHPDDALARGREFEAVSIREVWPSFDFAVQMDRLGADPAGRSIGARADADPAMKGLAAVFAAAATDPILGRGVLRIWNLCATLDDLMADPAFMARALEVMGDPDAYPAPDAPGPRRSELLAALAGSGAPVDRAAS